MRQRRKIKMSKRTKQIIIEFENLINKLHEYCDVQSKLNKYTGNQHYKKRLKSSFLEINHLMKKIRKTVRTDTFNYDKLFSLIEKLIDKDNVEFEESMEKIQLAWQDLQLDMDNLQVHDNSYCIPKEILLTDIRLDLEEAIRDFQNGCYLSAIVMCRRAYEGALISKFKQIELKDPIKQLLCKNCKNIVKDKVYMGIVELHKWAVDKKIISEKFKDIGFLIPNLGAGGAHPTDSFPRDSDVANISITSTIVLLKQINTSKLVLE